MIRSFIVSSLSCDIGCLSKSCFCIATSTSSALATELSIPNPHNPNALPITLVSQFSM